jgi:hypothetical protein
VAGINEKGEFRRLYPVPFKPLRRGGGIPFRKRDWIEARLLPPDDQRDTRVESRKIDLGNVRIIGQEDYGAICDRIQKYLSPSVGSIKKSGASLGLIKPVILGYDCAVQNTSEIDESQLDLEGNPITRVNLGQVSRYRFYCQDRQSCWCGDRPHLTEIHDWEANELYRNIIRTDQKVASIREKMRKKWIDWMIEKERDVYFMMGTHHRWKVWMIVSVLYPPKKVGNCQP